MFYQHNSVFTEIDMSCKAFATLGIYQRKAFTTLYTWHFSFPIFICSTHKAHSFFKFCHGFPYRASKTDGDLYILYIICIP